MPEPDPAKYTPTLLLYKPDSGESGWGAALDTDLDILDRVLEGIEYTFENINIVKLGGNPIALGKGVATTGTMRVAVVDDDTNLAPIEVNTRSTATNLVSIATTLSAPLGVHILDDEDEIAGIDIRPLTIYNPVNANGDPLSLSVVLRNVTNEPLEMDNGISTPATLRVVHADDSPDVLTIQNIDTNIAKTLNTVILSQDKTINIQNTVLREINGQLTGIYDHPLFVTLMQDEDYLRFSFGSGMWDDTTLRVVFATNDPNLATIKDTSTEFSKTVATNGAAPPDNIMQVGMVVDEIEGGVVTGSHLSALQGHDDGGLFTHVQGGLVGATLQDGSGIDMATKPYPLFIRNADNEEDRGQSDSKPFYVTVTDPVDIGCGLNVIQLGGYAISRKRGIIEEGTQRICIADDDTNFSRMVLQLQMIVEKLTWLIEHPVIKYTVSTYVLEGEGYVTPPYSTVKSGGSASFFIIPESGWQIDDIYLDNVSTGSTNATQTLTNITKDMSLSISFSELPEIVHHIVASVSAGSGAISPSGSVAVADNGVATFTALPAAGWQLDKFLIDGVAAPSETSPYVFTDVAADHTIQAAFKVATPTVCTLTASVYVGSGTISPAGVTSVNAGTSKEFTLTPGSGYKILQLLVDGVPVTVTGTTYTLTNIQTNHTIAVGFNVIPVTTYTITSSVKSGSGTITPLGVRTVTKGGTSTFTFAPAQGYQIASLTIDGITQNYSNTTYTFTNVQANHIIQVTYTQIPYAGYGYYIGCYSAAQSLPYKSRFCHIEGSQDITVPLIRPAQIKQVLLSHSISSNGVTLNPNANPFSGKNTVAIPKGAVIEPASADDILYIHNANGGLQFDSLPNRTVFIGAADITSLIMPSINAGATTASFRVCLSDYWASYIDGGAYYVIFLYEYSAPPSYMPTTITNRADGVTIKKLTSYHYTQKSQGWTGPLFQWNGTYQRDY